MTVDHSEYRLDPSARTMVFWTAARMLSSAWSSVWKNRPFSLIDRQDRSALKPDHGVRDMAQIGDVDRHRPFAALLPAKPQLFDDDVQHGHGP